MEGCVRPPEGHPPLSASPRPVSGRCSVTCPRHPERTFTDHAQLLGMPGYPQRPCRKLTGKQI